MMDDHQLFSMLAHINRPRRCGIHGEDTTSGRCWACDQDRMMSRLAALQEYADAHWWYA